MVSIIIPVYQVSEYVERCIRSVMAQSYQDIECVIVDDCGEDDSIEKCERLIKEYNDNVNLLETAVAEQATIGRADHNLDHNLDGKGRIRFKILHHEMNRGLSAARNTGTDASQGDYIYYLDSDDELTSDCIEVLMKAAQMDETIEMVQGNSVTKGQGNDKEAYWDERSVHLKNNDEVREWYYKRRTLKVSVWNKLLKREFVIGCNLLCKEGVLFEDLLWSFYLMKKLNNAVLCKEVTHYYYIRPQSITTGIDKKKQAENYSIVYKDILHNLTSGKEIDEIRGYLYIFCKTYMECVKSFPEFRETLDLYISRARFYGCRYECIVLSIIAMISKFGNPLFIFEPMNNLRWKVKRLFKNESNT